MTTRWVKSALTRSSCMFDSSKAFGKWSQVHLMGPGRLRLHRQIEIALRNRARVDSYRSLRSEPPIGLRCVDQSIEHDMREMHALRAEFARQRLRQPA